MKRLVVILVATFAAWLGAVIAEPAVATPTSPRFAPTYAYDASVYDDPGAYIASERGPPAVGYADTAYNTVDLGSHGTLTRPDASWTASITTYATAASPAQVGEPTATTSRQVVVTDGDLSSLEPFGVAANGGSKIIEGARYPLHPKIQRQLSSRGWTTGAIDEAVKSGQQVRAVNKATGNPATRYVHPSTGQSVAIDDVTGQVIHVGGPGFKYGPASGDVP